MVVSVAGLVVPNVNSGHVNGVTVVALVVPNCPEIGISVILLHTDSGMISISVISATVSVAFRRSVRSVVVGEVSVDTSSAVLVIDLRAGNTRAGFSTLLLESGNESSSFPPLHHTLARKPLCGSSSLAECITIISSSADSNGCVGMMEQQKLKFFKFFSE